MIAFVLLACSSKGPSVSANAGEAVLRFGEHELTVEIVADNESRAQGLMHRKSMDENRGMLFIYPDEAVRQFWMKNTHIPLSIAFANRKGKIVTISDMEPFDLTRTSSFVPAKYAVETNVGWFDKREVKHGLVIEGIPDVEAK
ncbi:MAG: DUF192 domain-containing protein [Myxococcota bacterium]